MQNVLTVAAVLATFVSMIMEAVKPLLPQPAGPARQDAYVRVATGIVGIGLSVAVYLFTASHFSRLDLGQALAEGGIAAGMATGLWHGITAIGFVASTVRVNTQAPAPAPVAPSFVPIANDPLKAAPPPAATPPAPAS